MPMRGDMFDHREVVRNEQIEEPLRAQIHHEVDDLHDRNVERGNRFVGDDQSG
jgi:hypothetical protein